MKNLPVWLLLFGFGGVILTALPCGAHPAEWTLRVSRDGAPVHLKPDAASPVAVTLPKGTVVRSAAKEGAWFRVVVQAGSGGALVIGYVGSADVEVTQKPAQTSDLWEKAPEEYRVARLSVRVGGGFLFFGSGDISDGALGEFDRTVQYIASRNTEMKNKQRASVRSGYDITGDIIFNLNKRVGLGVRWDYIHTYPKSSLLYSFGGSSVDYTLDTTPLIDAYGVRLGLYYEKPLSRLLSFQANGGPAVYFVKYEFARRFIVPGREDDIHLKVTAARLGLQGGLGLELKLDKRAGLYAEAQGRLARITGLKGTEWVYIWDNYITTNTETGGFLYRGDDGGYPVLSVKDDKTAAGSNFRRAVLDLSGISLAAGIRIRF